LYTSDIHALKEETRTTVTRSQVASCREPKKASLIDFMSTVNQGVTVDGRSDAAHEALVTSYGETSCGLNLQPNINIVLVFLLAIPS
jgi:hypothetical protein